ncbi:hypothetical protein I302_104414 [Kwoniella bestiolae CBS 10118]|uniref:Uncharacterized protein n=1 Tax=Kwoniella bestiolae CBS 10118 TaxID=1296100 RepID=A0A1B9GB82_9TREE|nr:hypothetical protein I302_03119 [Kwoniella bestiolae CBS 10118]OCF28266.1 hypothetical protein I302_03119 [Kwoniella bestiolae CBS 10118]
MSDSEWDARHVISYHAELVDVNGKKSIKTTFRIDPASDASCEIFDTVGIREERMKLAELYSEALELAASSRSTQWIQEYDVQSINDADLTVIMKEWNHSLNNITGTLCSGNGHVKICNTKGSTIKPGSSVDRIESASQNEGAVGEKTFQFFGKRVDYGTIYEWREKGLKVMKQTRKEFDWEHSKDVADCMLYNPSIPQEKRAPYLAAMTIEAAYDSISGMGFPLGRHLLYA